MTIYTDVTRAADQAFKLVEAVDRPFLYRAVTPDPATDVVAVYQTTGPAT